MNNVRLAAGPAILCVGLLAACGPSSNSAASSSTGATSSTSAGSSSTSSPAGGSPSSVSAATASCPRSNTRSFAKTRFATDVGLAAGTFHRYLWKPYQAGTFKKGANGHIRALIKGGTTAALDLKLMSNATKNVQANPTLCKTLYQPISDVADKLSGLKGGLATGSFTSLTSLDSAFSKIKDDATQGGLPITESTDETQANNG